jgi:hypothetical protein
MSASTLFKVENASGNNNQWAVTQRERRRSRNAISGSSNGLPEPDGDERDFTAESSWKKNSLRIAAACKYALT